MDIVEEESILIEKEHGCEKWVHIKYRSLLHRIHGPAIITPDKETWYLNGYIHRDNGPAVVFHSKVYEGWYRDGKLHREDGPARVYRDTILRSVWPYKCFTIYMARI